MGGSSSDSAECSTGRVDRGPRRFPRLTAFPHGTPDASRVFRFFLLVPTMTLMPETLFSPTIGWTGCPGRDLSQLRLRKLTFLLWEHNCQLTWAYNDTDTKDRKLILYGRTVIHSSLRRDSMLGSFESLEIVLSFLTATIAR